MAGDDLFTVAVILILAMSIQFGVNGMGLCDFEEKFPSSGSNCFRHNAPNTRCPVNMYKNGNCTCGKRTCEDPDTCINTCRRGLSPTCVPCPEGFYMLGVECVAPEECGCYIEEEAKIVPEGQTYVSPDCTQRGTCSNGHITLDPYCSPNGSCANRGDGLRCYCNNGYYGDGQSCHPARDCQDYYDYGVQDSGIYYISPPYPAFTVYCNMSDGGGWTVFQRRQDGSVDFYRNWQEYKTGFGDPSGEFWLGNDKLYYLTNQMEYQLRIDLVNEFGDPYYANYTSFRINDETDNYRLAVLGTFSGTVGDDADALRDHLNSQFSTKDQENDSQQILNCAVRHHGAWWYNQCHRCNLNGGYYNERGASIGWSSLPDSQYKIKFTEMKIRPV